ncbi:MAG: BspA family leucine-rich repeat surface protein [Bacteroidaceae bacterium]|nr:BspA family leucine-rich repeat surface protein [Bacteroidaceae bacterium]
MRAIMVMLVMLASVTAGAQEMASWVLWNKTESTLYFVRDNVAHQKSENHNGYIIYAWRIPDKADPQGVKTTNKASWSSAKKDCTKVVFEDSFSAARPIYCIDWFNGFKKLTSIEGIKNLKTDEVTSMKQMFKDCSVLNSDSLDLSGFITSKVTDMSGMFWGCSALTTLDLSNFDTSQVTDMNSMFYKCSALTELDVSNFNATSVTDISSMFVGCSALDTLKMSGFEATNLKKMKNLFKGCDGLRKIDMSGFNTGNVSSLASFFSDKKRTLTTIDLSGMKAPNVKNMSKMFYNCPSLKTVNLSKLDAPVLTNMSGMFAVDGKKIISSLETVDLSGIIVHGSKTLAINSMFENCSALTSLNLSGFDAPMVSSMKMMFKNCSALTTLDLKDLYNTYPKNRKKTTAATMNSMFEGCSNLKSIFVDDRRWSKVDKGGGDMFKECYSLEGEDGTKIENCNPNDLKKKGAMFAHTDAGGLLKKYYHIHLLTGDFATFYLGGKEVKEARNEDIITMKVNVPEGNTLIELTAMCGKTKVALTYDDVKDVYTFTMPEGAVTVATTFSQNYTLTGMEGITFRIGEEVVTQALAGTTVSYTVSIPAGKEIDEVTVMQGENTVQFIEYEDGTGQFTMPAGDVTVTVTYADAPVEPVEYTLTGEDNMSFYYVDGGKAEEDENEDETSIIKAWKVWPGNDIIVRVDEPEGKAVDVLTVKQGETSLEVKTNEDGDLYFTMPAGDVTVTATYMDPFNLLSGELVDAESGERVNDYVDFYNDKLNLINEAFKGEKVLLDVNPDVIPANMYFTGVFTSDDVTIVEEDETTHYIIMPEKDVTVNAVMASQETLVLNLLTNDATETIDNGELASLMMQWEGYLVGSETVQDNPSESYPYTCHWYFDLDGNGVRDVVLTERCINESTESTYTIQRLEGAASLGENYCLTLRSPGLPLKYKDALFNFGKSETITCVFFFEELSNKHTLANYDGKTVNASFPDRVLYKDGDWNTICLPFDVTVAGSPLDGDGVTVKTLKGASLENGTLTMTFTEGSETELKAGVPYLIKWTKPEPYVAFNYEHPELASDLYAPTFKNVTLDIILKPVVVTDLIAFDGTYTSWEYKQDSPSVLLMGAENNLFYPKYYSYSYSYLNCFRAYFQLLGGIKAIDPGLGGSIKSMVIDFGEEETDIEELKDRETGDVKNEGWYTLSGVKLAGKPSVSGIYLFNGKKVVIK